MVYDFSDKVIWITGASSGIGEALAYALSGRGAKLILSSRRADELERVRLACAHPDGVRVIPLDLLEMSLFGDKAAEAIAAFGQIDVVVHNGGISQRSLAIETPLGVQRRVMELDHFSYVALTQAVLPHFAQRRSGQFVVMSSVMGKIGTPMRSAYAAAKHALHGYFDCLRAELASLGIGLAADRAAAQILRAMGRRKYEAYIGRMGPERIALWVNRWFPGVFIRMAPKLVPK